MSETPGLPPHDLQAEEAVLGCLLLDGETMYKLSGVLAPEDFFREQNRWLYQASLSVFSRNQAVDQVTVAHELSRMGRLEAAGGPAYLLHLQSTTPSSFEVEHYADIVHRLSRMRQLIAAAGQIAVMGYEAGPDVDTTLDRAEDMLYRLRRGEGVRDLTPIRRLLDHYFKETDTPAEGGGLPHIFTGFAALDAFLGGLQRSDLVVLAARPSLGKTSLSLGMARNAALDYNACVAMFSLEMSKESVVERLLSAEATIDTHRLRRRDFVKLADEEEERLFNASGVLSEANIFIDDTPQPRMVEIRSKARRLNNERRVDLIIVDYLQLAQGEGRSENRVQEISYISRALKGLARELEVPVLAVSQLSRAAEFRASHRPQLSDLRDSGSIEQDADIVMFIYRDEYYYKPEDWAREHPEEDYPQGVADIIIAKHRNGPTGEVKLRWVSRTARFENFAPEQIAHEALPGFSS
ncbi:MAG: replicative DNA helicase [Dehalococcoidia bacterium]